MHASHAANDDRIFSWDETLPTGHPGDDYGCRCSAEPILDGAQETPTAETAFAILPAAVLTEEAVLLLINIAARLKQIQRGAATMRGANVLLDEIQQQEEEGQRDAEASQPPAQQPASPPESPEDPEDKAPKDILNPDGKPIGKRGKRPEVRIEEGGDKAAQDLYKRLGKGGKPHSPEGYPGEGTKLPNGDWVGYRPRSKSGSPTVDVDVKGVPYDKIHFP